MFVVGNILSIIASMSFFYKYFMEYEDLFIHDGVNRILREGIFITDFPIILGRTTIGFYIVSLCMLFYVIHHYGSYKNGSMSIYLMKRLPNPYEMHIRAWTLPVTTAVLSTVIGILMAIFYFGFYLLVTPSQCLAPDQWHSFWSYFSYFI